MSDVSFEVDRFHRRLKVLERINKRLPLAYLRAWAWYAGHRSQVLLLGLLVAEAGALFAFGRRVLREPVPLDIATAVYYALSTIAQTTATLAGFLLAFIALRLPMVASEIRAYEGPVPPSERFSALVTAVINADRRSYYAERESLVRRAFWALGMSGAVVLTCFFGLTFAPQLSRSEQSGLLMFTIGLASLALDAQVLLVLPSLHAMRGETTARVSRRMLESFALPVPSAG